MTATKGYLSAALFFVWCLPLTGILDRALAMLPLEGRAIVLLLWCTTFATLTSIEPISGMATAEKAIRLIIILAMALFCLASNDLAGLSTSPHDLFSDASEAHLYPIHMKSIYAIGGFYILFLRTLTRATKRPNKF